ncbi:unnamed protein product [Heterobilharzia americana]|nr:unnamed protein product [Heterobilharzia americana]
MMNTNICNTIDHSLLNPCQASTPIIAHDTSIVRKRGRRSTIPPEYREQTRKLKKQNLERRRRACISDKMNALHNLAMDLIGEDPTQYQKIEKTDILNICHSVFENVVAIVNEQPDIRERVNQLRNEFHDKLYSNQSNSLKENSIDEGNNMKKSINSSIPLNHHIETNSHNHCYQRQQNVLKTLNSNEITSSRLFNNCPIHHHFPKRFHSTLNTTIKRPITRTDTEIRSIQITPSGQSIDSGFEDIENTTIDLLQSSQTTTYIQSQIIKIPKKMIQYHHQYDVKQSQSGNDEQVIDLSFKKLNQIDKHEEMYSLDKKNVWRPYLD